MHVLCRTYERDHCPYLSGLIFLPKSKWYYFTTLHRQWEFKPILFASSGRQPGIQLCNSCFVSCGRRVPNPARTRRLESEFSSGRPRNPLFAVIGRRGIQYWSSCHVLPTHAHEVSLPTRTLTKNTFLTTRLPAGLFIIIHISGRLSSASSKT